MCSSQLKLCLTYTRQELFLYALFQSFGFEKVLGKPSQGKPNQECWLNLQDYIWDDCSFGFYKHKSKQSINSFPFLPLDELLGDSFWDPSKLVDLNTQSWISAFSLTVQSHVGFPPFPLLFHLLPSWLLPSPLLFLGTKPLPHTHQASSLLPLNRVPNLPVLLLIFTLVSHLDLIYTVLVRRVDQAHFLFQISPFFPLFLVFNSFLFPSVLFPLSFIFYLFLLFLIGWGWGENLPSSIMLL